MKVTQYRHCACNIPYFYLVNICKIHLHFIDEETEAYRSLNIFSAYETASSKDSWISAITSFKAIPFSKALCSIKKVCFKKLKNGIFLLNEEYVCQRYVWNKCHVAVVNVNRLLAVPVPMAFDMIISRLHVRVSQCFIRINICGYHNCVLLLHIFSFPSPHIIQYHCLNFMMTMFSLYFLFNLGLDLSYFLGKSGTHFRNIKIDLAVMICVFILIWYSALLAI